MTADELIDRIRIANADKTALCIQGSGSKSWLGQSVRGEMLDTRGYAGIIAYDPSELVITAKCGTPLAEINRVLAEQQQMLAFEPPAFGAQATIGGVIAAGLAGPRRAYSGAARDFVLGAVLVNGSGERLTFGGQVMKNVAGYDVARLLCGSMGCLGLILEMSIKVLPRPRNEVSLTFELTQDAALKKLNTWASKPLPISASAWNDQRLTLRLSGSEAAIDTALQQLGGETLTDHDASAYWAALREQTLPFFQGKSLWRLSLPSTAPVIDLAGRQLIEWGGAQRWLVDSHLSTDQIRQHASALGGHATLFKGGDKSVGVYQPLPDALMKIQRRLKAAFDPSGIFNPDRLHPGL